MPNLDQTYMQMALAFAKNSKGIRAKVGAILVTKNDVILSGYNGTPKGCDNTLEYVNSDGSLVTKPDVLHAELNCILKAAREGVSCVDSTVYVTLSPCVQCAAMLIQAGVKRVVYLDTYRDTSGIEYLENNSSIIVEKGYINEN